MENRYIFFDQIYHDTLEEKNPDLYATVKQLVERGQSPQAIARQVERKTGQSSVLPGLVEAAARIIKKDLAKS